MHIRVVVVSPLKIRYGLTACSFGWCWFVLGEKYCWLVADGWFVLREKYCWLVTDKPNEQGVKMLVYLVIYSRTLKKIHRFMGSGFQRVR
jgi:hypothetical protein